ncbi:MAG: septum formation initiator family protein [Holosporales bacterium]|jgi:cell division protein FtsB|nr:septum formation initiator family protein [Holosporales bacterium]
MGLLGRFVGLPNSVKLAYRIASVTVAVVYLVFHSITGENGLVSYIEIKKQVEEKEEVLHDKTAELEIMKRRVALLGNNSLDLDFLEERCRVMLNYCYSDDVIIRDKAISLLR